TQKLISWFKMYLTVTTTCMTGSPQPPSGITRPSRMPRIMPISSRAGRLVSNFFIQNSSLPFTLCPLLSKQRFQSSAKMPFSAFSLLLVEHHVQDGRVQRAGALIAQFGKVVDGVLGIGLHDAVG